MKNKRREFLKNISIATASVGVFSSYFKVFAVPSGEVCPLTTLDYYGQGPFYTQNPPLIINNLLASKQELGTRVIIKGTIHSSVCNEIIANAKVDVWHADANGAYDQQSYNLRGYTFSDEMGQYEFETILPGKYRNGSKYRPAHIHFRITSPDGSLLITQLYFQNDTDIPADAAASVTNGKYNATDRIIPLNKNKDGMLEGRFDMAITGKGVALGTEDSYHDKGVIYSISPNPVDDVAVIKYGVFNPAEIEIRVYAASGQLVAILEKEYKTQGKYEAVWNPNNQEVPSGNYRILLGINGKMIHYSNIVKR